MLTIIPIACMLMVNMNACIIATESIGVCVLHTIGILGVKSFVRTMARLRMPIIRITVFYQLVQLSYLVIGIATITQIDILADFFLKPSFFFSIHL